jgi:hypothetical protein
MLTSTGTQFSVSVTISKLKSLEKLPQKYPAALPLSTFSVKSNGEEPSRDQTDHANKPLGSDTNTF